ncbi:uncharacterized protein LOC116312279 isoform X4 [Oreochromis aureus]|uniref:uncharacterized protein LOC116312279 isoform X4 n=1 Tax=Oreochromis aureus TaxID=47969 RepID=UPI0019530B8F|nr:uncharacterized protein LOC116312279 isoform X4 [Oreochromis aureus]
MPWFKRMLRSVGLGILLLSVELVLSDSYEKVGDKVVLSPGSVSDRITSITWKHGPDIAVEWYGGDIVPYWDFRGRCEVSTSTGALTISNLTVKDSGMYTAEINNRVMSPTKITVISAVPKPTVSKLCNPEMTICTLTCEASITDDTKPVTYSWMIGDGQTPQSSSNQLRIAKNNTESLENSVSCQLENPVSSERSDNIIISFASGDQLHWIIPVIVTVIALFALIVGVIVFFLWKKYRHREIAPQNVANTAETVQLVGIQSNGAVVTAPEIHNENELESADYENEAEKFTTTSEVKVESGKDQTPAASTDSSSKPDMPALDSKSNETSDSEAKPETETSKTTSEVKDEPSQDQTPAASTDSSSKPETSKTTSEVNDESGKDQTPAASTDSSSKPDMPALDSKRNETSDSEAKPETDNLQEPQQGPERTT